MEIELIVVYVDGCCLTEDRRSQDQLRRYRRHAPRLVMTSQVWSWKRQKLEHRCRCGQVRLSRSSTQLLYRSKCWVRKENVRKLTGLLWQLLAVAPKKFDSCTLLSILFVGWLELYPSYGVNYVDVMYFRLIILNLGDCFTHEVEIIKFTLNWLDSSNPRCNYLIWVRVNELRENHTYWRVV